MTYTILHLLASLLLKINKKKNIVYCSYSIWSEMNRKFLLLCLSLEKNIRQVPIQNRFFDVILETQQLPPVINLSIGSLIYFQMFIFLSSLSIYSYIPRTVAIVEVFFFLRKKKVNGFYFFSQEKYLILTLL